VRMPQHQPRRRRGRAMTHRLSAGQMLTNRDEDTAEARGGPLAP
jgi:hypothetical protein